MNNDPIFNNSFIKLLEDTHCVHEKTGWSPIHFNINDSTLISYIKYHSYGEYIFDWAWAQFYQNNNLNYYPKIVHAIPFTPVNGPKLLGDQKEFHQLATESFQFYQENSISSEHYLFINNNEDKILEDMGFTTKLSHQYHFYNKYNSFEDFLSKLKKRKRKTILKERASIKNGPLKIKQLQKDEITKDILNNFYNFYLSTVIKKGAIAYLTKEFFSLLNTKDILITAAYLDEEIIAMALFFYNDEKLYGRNWGINPKYEQLFPYLHFELCYYQGIDFSISNNIKIFEAGAQGEHKLLRGFTPVIIKSSHHIKIDQCYEIIKEDIRAQNKQTLQNIEVLKQYLPYKEN